ncbi:hypothetical protein EYF80_043287 [Liparis tanakae]|uniref:Uncharacterized protein n=1 Tax=Liparis tanakae TaxID=230148 RepID=A0A4Z2G0U9_9TELE|nr:hypothetical protein EYF80_043287 [Liparis tanakae]
MVPVGLPYLSKRRLQTRRDTVLRLALTCVGESSVVSWMVGMSSLSHGGFFLCRLLFLLPGSSVLAMPPLRPPAGRQQITKHLKNWVFHDRQIRMKMENTATDGERRKEQRNIYVVLGEDERSEKERKSIQSDGRE